MANVLDMNLNDLFAQLGKEASDINSHEFGLFFTGRLPMSMYWLIEQPVSRLPDERTENAFRDIDLGLELKPRLVLFIVHTLQRLLHLQLADKQVLVRLLQLLLLMDHLEIVQLELIEHVLQHLRVREVQLVLIEVLRHIDQVQ